MSACGPLGVRSLARSIFTRFRRALSQSCASLAQTDSLPSPARFPRGQQTGPTEKRAQAWCALNWPNHDTEQLRSSVAARPDTPPGNRAADGASEGPGRVGVSASKRASERPRRAHARGARSAEVQFGREIAPGLASSRSGTRQIDRQQNRATRRGLACRAAHSERGSRASAGLARRGAIPCGRAAAPPCPSARAKNPPFTLSAFSAHCTWSGRKKRPSIDPGIARSLPIRVALY